MRIPYQLRGRHFLPLCDVVIKGAQFNVSVPALIDSGAFRPIFLKSTARDAGLSPESGTPEEVVFGGSTAIGRLLKTNVLIQGRGLEIDILYVDELKFGYALLGRMTFFDQFNQVAFHERDPKRKNVLFRD